MSVVRFRPWPPPKQFAHPALTQKFSYGEVVSPIPMSISVQQKLAIALDLFQRGKIEEADLLAGEAIMQSPQSADALHLRGVIAGLQNRHSDAEGFLRAAVSLDKKNPFIHFNLAKALSEQGRHAEALPCYERTILLNRENDKAWLGFGISLSSVGDVDGAIRAFDQALTINPSLAEAHTNKANCLSRNGLFIDALTHHDRALAANPKLSYAWNNRGLVLLELKRYKEALNSFEQSVKIREDYAEAWGHLGIARYHLNDFINASVAFSRALDLGINNPEVLNLYSLSEHCLSKDLHALEIVDRLLRTHEDFSAGWHNRGVFLSSLFRVDEAISSYLEAINRFAGQLDSMVNLGNIYFDRRDFSKAIDFFQSALSIDPAAGLVYNNIGNVFAELGRNQEAISAYRTCLRHEPEYHEAHWNLSLTYLRLGNFEEGWRLYESRWKKSDFTSPRREFTQQLWLGDFSVDGRRIFVHAEQGLGDTIQFCRLLTRLKDLRAYIIFEVPGTLYRLLSDLDGVDLVISQGDIIPAFDCHCPLMSLPLALGLTVSEIPAHVPYVRAKSLGHPLLSPLDSNQTKIAIAWAGNPRQKNDRIRSIPFEVFSGLLSEDFLWVSVQLEVRVEDDSLFSASNVCDLRGYIQDFSDTAFILSKVDLVITVDTSVAHLAGAMGIPVWVLLPYIAGFLWMTERKYTPWYPTMQLYRQSKDGQWEDVLSDVRQSLRTYGLKRALES